MLWDRHDDAEIFVTDQESNPNIFSMFCFVAVDIAIRIRKAHWSLSSTKKKMSAVSTLDI